MRERVGGRSEAVDPAQLGWQLDDPERNVTRGCAAVVNAAPVAFVQETGESSYDLVPGEPTRLDRWVTRLTAPNPGMMTGPGPNSYIVGEGDLWIAESTLDYGGGAVLTVPPGSYRTAAPSTGLPTSLNASFAGKEAAALVACAVAAQG